MKDDTLRSLPVEIWLHDILPCFTYPSILDLRLVCRFLDEIVRDYVERNPTAYSTLDFRAVKQKYVTLNSVYRSIARSRGKVNAIVFEHQRSIFDRRMSHIDENIASLLFHTRAYEVVSPAFTNSINDISLRLSEPVTTPELCGVSWLTHQKVPSMDNITDLAMDSSFRRVAIDAARSPAARICALNVLRSLRSFKLPMYEFVSLTDILMHPVFVPHFAFDRLEELHFTWTVQDALDGYVVREWTRRTHINRALLEIASPLFPNLRVFKVGYSDDKHMLTVRKHRIVIPQPMIEIRFLIRMMDWMPKIEHFWCVGLSLIRFFDYPQLGLPNPGYEADYMNDGVGITEPFDYSFKLPHTLEDLNLTGCMVMSGIGAEYDPYATTAETTPAKEKAEYTQQIVIVDENVCVRDGRPQVLDWAIIRRVSKSGMDDALARVDFKLELSKVQTMSGI
ncbi:hypothetical protein BZA70DRAFT_281900 [Myxozyma melibiosi]|uniref:F-box domain-containing protein n=1 Tax=Myxozyma melibiosi TaxID=54550 RepID=A0ABR1F1M3_9ASCO